MAESDKTGIGQMLNDAMAYHFNKQAEKLQEWERELIEKDLHGDPKLFDGFHSLIEKDMEQETTMDFSTTLKGGERVIIHLNLDYMESMYAQKEAKTREEKKQIADDIMGDIVNFIHGKGEKDYMFAYDFADRSGKTHQSWWLEFIDREEEDDRLTEKQIYDDYQERSVTAGNRAEQLAWAFVVILCAQLVGGEHFKEPYVIAAGGICYMLLSALQSLWQAFSMWLFKQKVKRENLQVSDYPNTIGGIAWAFYWAKMIVISITAIYAVVKFVQLI